MGMCIGGHLAFRAAMQPDVLASTCFYATDIHKRSLGEGMRDNSLERIGEITGELLMISRVETGAGKNVRLHRRAKRQMPPNAHPHDAQLTCAVR